MNHYIVSAVPSDDPAAMPVAEVEIDAQNEAEAIEAAKDHFRRELTTLEGLAFSALEVKD
jgi:hypothetical protein